MDTMKQYAFGETNQHLHLLCLWVQKKMVQHIGLYCGIQSATIQLLL